MRKGIQMALLMLILLTSQMARDRNLMTSSTSIHIRSTYNSSYTTSSPIEIVGDADFASQASANSWAGNGSSEAPYVITDLNITIIADDIPLISISDTTSYFIIEHCLLFGGSICIRFSNICNGKVVGNLIFNATDQGVYLYQCSYTALTRNIIERNGQQGILVDYSYHCNISYNTVTCNSNEGLRLRDSDCIFITSNVISDNTNDGLVLGHSSFNEVHENIINGSSRRGISIEASIQANCTSNAIYDNDEFGLSSTGDDCIFDGNMFYHNSFHGLRIDGARANVTHNNFIDNGYSYDAIAHALDISVNSSFSNNYYNDWVVPDNDHDNVVDIPYAIDGEAFNQDQTPQVQAYLCHHLHVLTRPMVLFPNESLESDYFYGLMNITWCPSSDTYGHDVNYSIYYSTNENATWIEIVTGLSNLWYLWNTSAIEQDLTYVVKVIAICSGGLISEALSSASFTIREHFLIPLVVVFPNGGEIIGHPITIQWTESIDSWNHSIVYRVYYSRDGGITWHQIGNDTIETSYQWDLSYADDGTYLIKVIAISSCGLTTEDVSDGVFTLAWYAEELPVALVVSIVVLVIVMYLRKRRH